MGPTPETRFSLPVKGDYKPISGYGIIGNTRTAALVGYDGSIDWCCMPKFSSPSIFASILDHRKGGRWAVRPSGSCSSTQSYIEDTNILRTEFRTVTSRVVVTDFMPCSVTPGAWSTPPEIHRIVESLSGEMEMQFVFSPVFDYGSEAPNFTEAEYGVSIRNRREEMVLSTSAVFPLTKTGIDGKFRIGQGEKKAFVLSYGEGIPRKIRDYQSERKRAKTEVFWLDWVSLLRYRGRWKEAVTRSALILKLLVYAPTGAMVAAPTTSLPESLGGERNWDYRYSWIRDSASSLWAFHKIGCRSEAEAYLRWLIDNNPSLDLDLRLMYDVNGGTNFKERSLDHLEGYKKSRPVRVGNQAVEQLQLDAYGYMLDSIYFSSKHGRAIDEEMYFRFVKPLADYILEHWSEPGNGIWEIRDKREHYVYTKAWCWAGLDRAVKVARAAGHGEDVPVWASAMKQIKKDVLRHGWNEEKRSFTIFYGSKDLDAATLMLPLIGFLPADDEKMRSTIEAVTKELSDGALVYRYRANDGLHGKEGAFLLCGFWLTACLARLGRVGEASNNLQELLGRANHLGLYPEEVDPKTGDALGNFPQAFSHMGLILAANELDTALDSGIGALSE
ncbi:MAG: glycoside hydrolase family 15 protein [Thaumarchaeota archaeon]|nr:glycoside hydrolase family 15 protein [Nitrososphaerota archaeon]